MYQLLKIGWYDMEWSIDNLIAYIIKSLLLNMEVNISRAYHRWRMHTCWHRLGINWWKWEQQCWWARRRPVIIAGTQKKPSAYKRVKCRYTFIERTAQSPVNECIQNESSHKDWLSAAFRKNTCWLWETQGTGASEEQQGSRGRHPVGCMYVPLPGVNATCYWK